MKKILFTLTIFLFATSLLAVESSVIKKKAAKKTTSSTTKIVKKKAKNKTTVTRPENQIKSAPTKKIVQPIPVKVSQPQPESSTPILDKSLDVIDKTQGVITDSWRGFNYTIDSYFSDRRYKIEDNKSNILLYWAGQKRESKEFEYKADFAFKIHLPQTTKRLSITLEKERNEIFDATSSPANRNIESGKSEPTNYAAAVSYVLADNPLWKSSLSTGMKLLLPLDPFTKLKFYNGHRWKYFHISGSQNFILYRQDGFSEYTQLTFGIPLSQKFYLTQSNTLGWTDKDDQFKLRDDLTLGHAIDEKRGMSYTIGANAEFTPTFYYTGYDASISFRQRLFSDWFYGTITCGAEFLKTSNFEPTGFIQLRFDIQ